MILSFIFQFENNETKYYIIALGCRYFLCYITNTITDTITDTMTDIISEDGFSDMDMDEAIRRSLE